MSSDHDSDNTSKPVDGSVKPTEPTIPSERVPNFPASANEFRADQDFARWHDLSQRGDKALRRKLFMAARTFVQTAREYRGVFKSACKPLHIKGDNIEAMAVRFLFGPTLDKHAVHLWSCVVKYWRECEPEQQDVEAAAERKLTELKNDYRKFKNGEREENLPAGGESDCSDAPPLGEFVAESLMDYEPNIIISPVGNSAAGNPVGASRKITAYQGVQFADGTEHLYAVPLSETGSREFVGLIKRAEKNTTTQFATWMSHPLAQAAE